MSVFEYFKQNNLKEYSAIIQNVDNINFNETKKKLHSIKPAFKMVGLTVIEQDIELILSDSSSLDSIKNLLKHWNLSKIENIIDIQIDMLKNDLTIKKVG